MWYVVDLRERTVAEFTQKELQSFANFQQQKKRNKDWQERFYLFKSKIKAKKFVLKLMKEGF